MNRLSLVVRSTRSALSTMATRSFGSAPSKKGKETTKAYIPEGQSTQADDHTKKYIQMIDSKPRPRAPYTEEELEDHARIARAYNAEMRLQHDNNKHEMSVKIWMKNEAVKSIGGHWGEEAKKVDIHNLPPLWRKLTTYTPPIEGFDVRKYDSTNPTQKKQ